MTPLQLAQAECANYEPHGACLGMQIDDTGKITYCSPKPRCVLGARERCAYFEACIAPLADMVRDPRRAMAIQQAVDAYYLAAAGESRPARKCPDCGGPLPKSRQVCPACAEKRRKATFRRAQGRRRGNGLGLSTEVSKTPSSSLENSHGIRASCRNAYEDSGHPQNGPTSVDTPAPGTASAEGRAEA